MNKRKLPTRFILTLSLMMSALILFAGQDNDAWAQHAPAHDTHDEHIDNDHDAHGHEEPEHDEHHDSHDGHDDDAEGHTDDTHTHDDHSDDAHAEHSDDAHAGHGADSHDGHDDHDDHGAHDDHDDHEDGVLKVDPKNMAEFGIEVAPVGPGTLSESLTLNGEVVFNADRIAHVTPSVPGIVREVTCAVGDRVQAGQVMGVLDSRELAAARGAYLSAKARYQLAKESLARDEKLFNNRVGTERQVMETRQAASEAEIALNLAEHNLHAFGQTHDEIGSLSADDDTGFMTYQLRAPIDGVVTARHLTRGERIGEEPDEAPFVIADLSSVWVNLTVYQRDIESITPGMNVNIRFGQGKLTATGQIAFISPSLDEHTRTATARVVLDNTDGRWRPGMFVTAQADHGSTHSELVLPRSAIQYMEGETAVFVQNGDEYELRPITTGRESTDAVEVLSGLSTGEVVVTRNGFALKAEMNRGALEHAGHAH